jgi:arylsulfatase A-like enzyme
VRCSRSSSKGRDKVRRSRCDIAFVLAADLGYEDLGSYGHPYALTPNLNRLAEEGTRFQHFYAASPLCIPSRAGFMTGVFPARFANYTGDFGLGEVPTVPFADSTVFLEGA